MTNTPDLDQLRDILARARAEAGKVIIGQAPVLDLALIAIFTGQHALVEGVPGVAKTLLVRTLARVLGCGFGRIQFTPDLMPADITGTNIFNLQTQAFTLVPGPVFTTFLLADEINRAPAKTQAALLEVMQERQVTLEGQSLEVPAPFMTLATQNPIELEGTYPLPEAQIDRFLLKVQIDYPSAAEELELVRRVAHGALGDSLDLSPVLPVADAAGVIAIQAAAATVFVDERISEYVVRLVRATRTWPGVALGAGPRGGLALVRASRARALLEGRSFVTPDDVKLIALPALRHRLLLSPEVELEGQRADLILHAILAKVEAPRT